MLSESSVLLEEHQASSASQKLFCNLRGRLQALYPLKTGREGYHCKYPYQVFFPLAGTGVQGISRPLTHGDIVPELLDTLLFNKKRKASNMFL